jgi:hypothetical protein
VSAAVHEHSLEAGAVDNSHKTTPESGILHDTVASVPQERFKRRGVRRPNWPPREIVAALVVGATDLCLVLGAAAAAFATYFGVTDPTIAAPERRALTSFFAATLFVAFFERLGGYPSRQLSLLAERFEPALGIDR